MSPRAHHHRLIIIITPSPITRKPALVVPPSGGWPDVLTSKIISRPRDAFLAMATAFRRAEYLLRSRRGSPESPRRRTADPGPRSGGIGRPAGGGEGDCMPKIRQGVQIRPQGAHFLAKGSTINEPLACRRFPLAYNDFRRDPHAPTGAT